MFHTTPRCNPKLRQAWRRAPTAVILRSSSATPHGVILGRNPQGRRLFFRNPALQLAHGARYTTRTAPCLATKWPLARRRAKRQQALDHMDCDAIHVV
jgi:hypothetical protein